VGPAAHGLGIVAYYQGDNGLAHHWAQRALEAMQTTEQRRQARCALRLLGHALAGLGRLESAAVIYQQVLELDRTFGYPRLVLQTMADLARVALQQDDQDRAITYVVTMLDGLQDYSLAGLEEPAQAYLTCYEVLRAGRDPRAEEWLEAAHTMLTERAAQCTPARRRLFLENFPAHRALLRLWEGSRAAQASMGR
jgi:tetratricopeptide (TPR) repeat protein